MLSKQVKLVSFEKEDKKYHIFSKITVDDEYITFIYQIDGDLDEIDFREEVNNNRQWELWKETCFEVFLKYPDQKWYIEFNFSPSQSWNCFYLSGYRKKCIEFENISKIDIESDFSGDHFLLSAKVELTKIKELKRQDLIAGNILIGISAIVRNKTGKFFHYAIQHGEKKPDFHDDQNFKSDLFSK